MVSCWRPYTSLAPPLCYWSFEYTSPSSLILCLFYNTLVRSSYLLPQAHFLPTLSVPTMCLQIFYLLTCRLFLAASPLQALLLTLKNLSCVPWLTLLIPWKDLFSVSTQGFKCSCNNLIQILHRLSQPLCLYDTLIVM